jgi:hypothetical protein
MKRIGWACGAVLGVLLLCGCAEGPKLSLPGAKYNPVRIYNAPFPKVYEAAKKAMAAEKYKLDVEDFNEKQGSGSLVTNYIMTTSTVNFYTDDKGQKTPCRVKYIMHADLRTLDDGRTQLDLRVPEETEFHKTDIGTMWERTDTMHWRGEKVQNDIEAILAGREPSPPGEPPSKAAEPGKK